MSQVTLCRALTYSQVVKSRRYGQTGKRVRTGLFPRFRLDECASIRTPERVNALLKS